MLGDISVCVVIKLRILKWQIIKRNIKNVVMQALKRTAKTNFYVNNYVLFLHNQ